MTQTLEHTGPQYTVERARAIVRLDEQATRIRQTLHRYRQQVHDGRPPVEYCLTLQAALAELDLPTMASHKREFQNLLESILSDLNSQLKLLQG